MVQISIFMDSLRLKLCGKEGRPHMPDKQHGHRNPLSKTRPRCLKDLMRRCMNRETQLTFDSKNSSCFLFSHHAGVLSLVFRDRIEDREATLLALRLREVLGHYGFELVSILHPCHWRIVIVQLALQDDSRFSWYGGVGEGFGK